MVISTKKIATPLTKATPAVKVKIAQAAVAKRATSSLSQKSASFNPISELYAPMPKKKTGNRFTSDAASVLSYAIKAGIITKEKKLTASFK